MLLKSFRLLVYFVASLALVSGCGDEESGEKTRNDYAFDAVDYHANDHGLITPETLERWLGNWAEERPAHVDGDLVVLQVGYVEDALGTAAAREGVRVFDVSEDIFVLIEPRNNGIFAAGQAPARGVRVDAFLRKYGIDPRSDYVVFVAGELSEESLSLLSIGWLTLRYWGLHEDLLAIVNGDIEDLPTELRADEPLEALYDGTIRVLELPSTEFSLTLDLGDVRAWVQKRPRHTKLWDTRSLDAYEGRTIPPALRETSCVAGQPACTALYSGRIAGADALDTAEFLTEEGRILEPDALRALLSARGVDRKTTHYVYDGDGARSAIVAFILHGVTKQSVRWYPNSFVEWSALNATHAEERLRRVKEDSPWRTDTPEFTEAIDVWADIAHGIQPVVINSRAERADGVLHEDERYLTHPPALPVVNLNDPNCF